MTRDRETVDFERLDRVVQYEDPLTPTERKTFLFVAKTPGATASAIAEAVKLTPDAASRAFKKLIALDLIKTERDRIDRRIARFGITGRGHEELLKWASAALGHEVREITGLSVWDPE